MKRKYILTLLCVFASTIFFYSCIDKEYNIDNINKDGVFSQDNGIFVPLGSFDTIRFQVFETNTSVEVTYIKTFEGLFSGNLYKNFVIPNNKGVEEAIGAVTLSGDFLVKIMDSEAKEFSDFVISTVILKKDGQDTGISIAGQTLKSSTTSKQTYDIVINKEDVIKLKNAYSIKIMFDFSSNRVDEEDFVLISNVRLKSSGGIRLNWS